MIKIIFVIMVDVYAGIYVGYCFNKSVLPNTALGFTYTFTIITPANCLLKINYSNFYLTP